MFDAKLEYTAEFIRIFDASLDIKLWVKLLKEELDELQESLQETDREHVLKETADVLYVVAPVMALSSALAEFGMLSGSYLEEDLMPLAARMDKYFATVSTMFSKETVAEALKLVHESNMSKLDENGKPIRREDGKILKGPNYKEPDLKALAK